MHHQKLSNLQIKHQNFMRTTNKEEEFTVSRLWWFRVKNRLTTIMRNYLKVQIDFLQTEEISEKLKKKQMRWRRAFVISVSPSSFREWKRKMKWGFDSITKSISNARFSWWFGEILLILLIKRKSKLIKFGVNCTQ